MLPPFQRLLDDHGVAVYRFLLASVGAHDAPDCYQDTLVSALKAYPSLPHGDNLKGWLFTIAHHKAIDAHRARARNPVPVAKVHERADRPPPPPPAAAGDHWERVRALPARQREVLTLRYAADLTHGEIATVLHCTEEAARRAAADGLKNLRKELTDVAATA